MTIIEHWQIDGGYYRLSEKLLHYEEFEGYVNTATKITYKSDEVILEFERYSPKAGKAKANETLDEILSIYESFFYHSFVNIKKEYGILIEDTIKESFDLYLNNNNLDIYFQDGYVFIRSLSKEYTEFLDKYITDNIEKIALEIFITSEEYCKRKYPNEYEKFNR